MKKQELNYIQQLDIQGLWGLYDVHLSLNPDVNIIVGENGSGKSTLLMILKMVAGLSVKYIKQKNFKNKGIKAIWKTDLGEESLKSNIGSTMSVTNKSFRFHHWNGKRPENILVNYVATFDSTIYSQNDFDEKNKPYIETHLDKELDEMLTHYTEYQTRLLKKSDNRGKSLSEVLQKRDWLFDKLNDLFKPTHNRFVESEEDTRPSVILSDGAKLSLFQLSSGEKQLLIILLTVLCQDEKSAILLLDEPEISLHTRWQHELMGIIRTLNPNCQIIAMTHSPSIFNDGWRDKVIWMADVLKETKPVLEAVNTEGVFLKDIFIDQFSKTIYALLVESLQSSINSGNSDEEKGQLGENIRLTSGSIDTMLANLKENVINKMQHFIVADTFKEQLAKKGLTPDTAYLLARGKDVLNSVFLKILKPIQEDMKSKKLLELEAIEDEGLRNRDKKAYRMGLTNVQTCLLDNRDFTDCFLFEKIENDIRKAFR